MPVLSAGKHRNPRKGACFMEFASYLAGEKWSDRPACTHPALAELARAVNDHVGDEARQTLLPMVPEVIGLNGDAPLIDVMVARECALVALPVVPLGRARVVALGLLRCEKALAEHQGRPSRQLTQRARRALDTEPHAYKWAMDFCQGSVSAKTFHGISAAAIIDYAVLGISEAAIDNPDEMLVNLLRSMIDLAHGWLGTPEPAATPTAPVPPVSAPATPPVAPAPH
jgi:hypothetical protein